MKITANQLRRIIKEEIAKAIMPNALMVANELADFVGGMEAEGDPQEAEFSVAYSAGDKADADDVIAKLSNFLKTQKRADDWGDKTSFHEFRFKSEDRKFETSVEFSTFDEAEYLNPGTITVTVKVYKV